MIQVDKNGHPLYEKSQNEHGGVIIRVKKTVYYYDLKRITDFVCSNENRLNIKIIGQSEREIFHGELAKSLYAALLDWHKGLIK